MDTSNLAPGRGVPADVLASGRGRQGQLFQKVDGRGCLSPGQARRFRDVVLVHAEAAYGLALRLSRRPDVAEDIVQDAYVRALSGFANYRGGDGRSWTLTIVRNRFYDWRSEQRLRATESMARPANDGDDERGLGCSRPRTGRPGRGPGQEERGRGAARPDRAHAAPAARGHHSARDSGVQLPRDRGHHAKPDRLGDVAAGAGAKRAGRGLAQRRSIACQGEAMSGCPDWQNGRRGHVLSRRPSVSAAGDKQAAGWGL